MKATPMMSFVEAVKTCFSKYATFSGRARRSEYWWFSLLNIVLGVCSSLVVNWKMSALKEVQAQAYGAVFDQEKMDALTAKAESMDTIFYTLMIIIGILYLVLLLPSLAVAVRRLHDTGRSGWIILLNFIPVVNFVTCILTLIYTLQDSKPETNQYGPSPKYVEDLSV